MKNIHLIPTDKPSRLFLKENALLLNNQYTLQEIFSKGKCQNIYITNDEEIKDGDKDFYIIANDRDKTWINRLEKVIECRIDPKHGKVLILSSGFIWLDEGEKIILTDNQDLIKDGVQAIDDKFLEWFVKNPSCEKVEVGHGFIKLTETDNKGYWVSIPDEEFNMKKEEINCFDCNKSLQDCTCMEDTIDMKQESIEEAAERLFPAEWDCYEKESFIEGAQWQAERMYSEEQMIEFGFSTYCYISELMGVPFNLISENKAHAMYNFEKFKKKQDDTNIR